MQGMYMSGPLSSLVSLFLLVMGPDINNMPCIGTYLLFIYL
jgi:hypothetical protein